jgi:hypothetical protein
MRTPVRYQSLLLLRRSYKPARATRRRLNITFHPARPVAVSISKIPKNENTDGTTSVEIALSG